MAHVLFQDHPMCKQEEFFILLPNERAAIEELQEEMSQMERFKKNNWYPHEMHFFTTAYEDPAGGVALRGARSPARDALDPDDFIDDYGTLTLRLIITYKWSSSESDSE